MHAYIYICIYSGYTDLATASVWHDLGLTAVMHIAGLCHVKCILACAACYSTRDAVYRKLSATRAANALQSLFCYHSVQT